MSFSAILKPVLKFLYHKRSKAAHFSLFTGFSLASVTKCIQLFVISRVRTVLYPPCSPVSVQIAHTAQCCLVVVGDGCMPGAEPGCSLGKSCCPYSTGQGAAIG